MGNESSFPGPGRETTATEDGVMEKPPDLSEDNGFVLSLDRDYEVLPTTKRCPTCPEEDNLHPLEYFTRYPCCCIHSDDLCRKCMIQRSNICGECFTRIPQGNELALLWLRERGLNESSPIMCNKNKLNALIGRTFILGSHTYLDEIQFSHPHGRLRPPHDMLSLMNPPNVQQGVMHLIMAAESGQISAMLDLADAYCTTWKNDRFQRDKKKAELWFQRAIGRGNKVHPIAITRYGDFLKWESRCQESRSMYHFSAIHGHARGQYEYAVCLLEGTNKDMQQEEEERRECTNDETVEAIQWLCRASENGFHVPSRLYLAKTLIQIFEEEYGTAERLGRSPLPRTLQILSMVKDGIHGTSESVTKEAEQLLKRYGLGERCANCGGSGSENNPLLACGNCGVVFYCSRVCIRRDFRYGHKFDCCSSQTLFDHHSIKLSLPWTGKANQVGAARAPSLQGQESRSLMQMVEDDTDEVYGEQELGYDEHLLTQLMLRMRINLETYLQQKLKEVGQPDLDKQQAYSTGTDVRNINLKKRIEAFSKCPGVSEEFVNAMHQIRELGNSAAHHSPNARKLTQEDCEHAVRLFRQCKETQQINESKVEKSRATSLETSNCEGSKKTGQINNHDVEEVAEICLEDKVDSNLTSNGKQKKKKGKNKNKKGQKGK